MTSEGLQWSADLGFHLQVSWAARAASMKRRRQGKAALAVDLVSGRREGAAVDAPVDNDAQALVCYAILSRAA